MIDHTTIHTPAQIDRILLADLSEILLTPQSQQITNKIAKFLQCSEGYCAVFSSDLGNAVQLTLFRPTNHTSLGYIQLGLVDSLTNPQTVALHPHRLGLIPSGFSPRQMGVFKPKFIG